LPSASKLTAGLMLQAKLLILRVSHFVPPWDKLRDKLQNIA